jgi:photosystem II stability/assembly factor-like uncharacterized protein
MAVKFSLFALFFTIVLKSYGQWRQLNPISGVTSITARNDNQAIAANNDEIFYTQDGGKNWKKSDVFTGGLGTFTPNYTSVAFQDSLVAFASGANFSGSSTSSLILKSIDGGKSWNRIPLGLNNSLEIQTFGSDTILAFGGFRILRSVNGGSNWSTVPNTLNFSSIRFFSPSKGFGLVRRPLENTFDIYQTLNSGNTWTLIATQTNTLNSEIDFVDKDALILKQTIINSTTVNNQVLLSTNQGQSFTVISPSLDDIPVSKILRKPDGKLISYYLSILPNGQPRLIARESSNNGLTFATEQELGNPLGNSPIAFSMGKTKCFVAASGIGEHRFSDNQFEFQTLSFLSLGENGDLIFTDKETGFISGFGSFIMKTTNGGLNWRPCPFGGSIGEKMAFPTKRRGFLLAKDQFFGGSYQVFRTLDSGNTWQQTNLNTLENLNNLDFWDENNGLIVGSAGSVYKTSNGGNSWTPLSTSTTFSLKTVAYSDANVVMAGGEEGNLLRSTDGGSTWNEVNLPTFSDINRIKFISSTRGFLVVEGLFGASDGKIFRTEDGGLSWTPDNFLPVGNPGNLAFNPFGQGLLFYSNLGNEYLYNPQTDIWTVAGSPPTTFSQGLPLVFPDSGVAYSVTTGSNQLDFFVRTIEPLSIVLSANRNNYCTGNQAAVNFVARGFKDTTFFILQISNANGSFSNPTDLASLLVPGAPVSTPQFNFTIPTTLVSGTGYRFRIISADPLFQSGDNGVNISIGITPNVQAGADTSLCQGAQSFLLPQFSPAGGRWTGTGVDSCGFFNPASAGIGIFNLTYTVSGNGCPASDSRQIRINSNPVVSLSSSPSTCGLSNGTATVLQSGLTYLWSNGQTSGTISNLNPGIYTVFVSDPSTTCKDTASILVSDSGNIQVSIANVQNNICRNGAQISLSANPNTGTWSGPGVSGSIFNPANAPVGQNILVYTLQQSGCTYLRSDTIQVLATPNVQAGTDRSICLNDPPVNLNGLPANGLWSGNCISNTGLLSIPSSPGNCQVVYAFSATNGCTGRDTANIAFQAIPGIQTPQLLGGTLKISLQPGESVQWFLDGQAVAGAILDSLTNLQTGSYTAQIRNSSGCVVLSNPILVTSVAQGFDKRKIRVYPNPASEKLNVEMKGMKDFDLEIFDALGRKMKLDLNTFDGGFQILVSSLPKGIYYLKSMKGEIQIPFVKE